MSNRTKVRALIPGGYVSKRYKLTTLKLTDTTPGGRYWKITTTDNLVYSGRIVR
jgi:hypothetical protein